MRRMRRRPAMLVAFGLLLSTSCASLAQEPPTEVGVAVPVADPSGASAGRIVIRGVEEPFTADAQASPPPSGQRYVLVTVRFEAADDKPFQADPGDVLLQDTDGYLWGNTDVPRSQDSLPRDLRTQGLSAGDRVTGVVGFVVPTSAVIDRILYQAASGQQLVALLDESPSTGQVVDFGTALAYADRTGTQAGLVTVRSAEDPFTAYPTSQPPAADQRYILITAVFEAAADQPFEAIPGGIVLQDTDGFLWEYAEVPRLPGAPGDVQDQMLSPGDRVSGPIGYVVPKSAIIERILYRSDSGTRLTTLVGPLASGSARPSSKPSAAP